MPIFEITCDIDAPVERVWEFHNSIQTLFRLTPPGIKATLEGEALPMAEGVTYSFRFAKNGIAFRMNSKIVSYQPPTCFVDEMMGSSLFFKTWRHEHRFEPISPNQTRLIDRVEYTMRYGIIGQLLQLLLIDQDLRQSFKYRHKVTKSILEQA